MTDDPVEDAVTEDRPVTSVAAVATDRPARYGKQLVSHLTRRATGQWSEEERAGWIDFGDGRVTLTSADGSLDLRLTSPVALVGRREDVVGRHLVRFGARDELVVAWDRDDGTPGTVQENAGDDGARADHGGPEHRA